MRKAVERLRPLEAGAADYSAGILGFQIALLEDDALSAPAFAAIEGGAPADVAWREALDNEIGGFCSAEGETFRARAARPCGLRGRRLGGVGGGGAATSAFPPVAPGAVGSRAAP